MRHFLRVLRSHPSCTHARGSHPPPPTQAGALPPPTAAPPPPVAAAGPRSAHAPLFPSSVTCRCFIVVACSCLLLLSFIVVSRNRSVARVCVRCSHRHSSSSSSRAACSIATAAEGCSLTISDHHHHALLRWNGRADVSHQLFFTSAAAACVPPGWGEALIDVLVNEKDGTSSSRHAYRCLESSP